MIRRSRNMRLSKMFGALLLTLLSTLSWAQEDSTLVMEFDRYMNLVRENHPVALQAGLIDERADAIERSARGGFDPKAGVTLDQKYFEGDQYFSIAEGGLKVPTWFGVELMGGHKRTSGVYLNPENNLPAAGLWYAGISIPIGEGLFIDQRRAELRKAEIFRESTRAQQRMMLNELLLEAGNAYWKWFEAYHELQVYENALQVAQQRFEAVKRSAVLGDQPMIDTLEAGIQVQNRELSVQQAQLELSNARAQLSVYLWADGMIPLEMEETMKPISTETPVELADPGELESNLDSLVNNHPTLDVQRFKIDGMEIERRWKQEQLKPNLDFNYFPLAEISGEDPLAAYSVQNYTWGLNFSMPIFLRKERGELQQTNLKLREARLGLTNKRAQLVYKSRAALNEVYTTNDQIELYSRTVEDYSSLLNGERQMFDAGESSLFMVNSRELGYINARVKLIELISKNRKARLGAVYSLGILNP